MWGLQIFTNDTAEDGMCQKTVPYMYRTEDLTTEGPSQSQGRDNNLDALIIRSNKSLFNDQTINRDVIALKEE